MNIQWFPGHMTKTRRILQENLKLVDVVIEILDARIPKSSQNPEINTILGVKPRVVVLNKEDLADPIATKAWKKYFNAQGSEVLFLNSEKGLGIKELKDSLRKIMKEKQQRERLKGIIFKAIKTMVVGIPNVGKSTLINRLSGGSGAITGDRPGVTKSKQWIRVNEEIQLLDTPGLLWPKFDDAKVGLNLAFTGAIKDEIMDTVELSIKLIERLLKKYPNKLQERFKLDAKQMTFEDNEAIGYQLLHIIGKKRGCIVSGGEVDLNRIAIIVLDEFRGGKIGRVTLELPEE